MSQQIYGPTSFGYGTRSNNFISKDRTPSPNQYVLQSTLSASASKFGRSTRTNQNALTPAPGQYEILQKDTRKIKITIKGKRKQNQDSSLIGPGSYYQELPKSSQKFGFGDRFLTDYSTYVPAPNHYWLKYSSLKKSNNHKNGYIFGDSKQDSIYSRSKTPAPNQYEIQNPNNTFGQSFCKATRDAYCLETPGVGQYELKQEQQNSHGFSFLKKYSPPQIPNYPGPGTYEIPSQKVTCSIKFNSIMRNNIFQKIENPGPGQYDEAQVIQKGIKFYTAPKIFDYHSISPGPAQYDTKELESKIGGVIGRLYRPKRISITPGPGQYYLDNERGRSISFSKQKRFKKDQGDKIGPGKYQIQMNKTNGISFSKQKKILDQSLDNPGPGQYNITKI